VDVETSGLDPYRDRLISIGAVGLTTSLLQFEDSFKVVLRQPRASPGQNIVVHGIDGTTQLAGTHPADALIAWLRFSRKAPLVGFHADFDRIVLARAMQEELGMALENQWIDAAMLLPALFPARNAETLDEWTKLFAIENHARHDALADAVATAQLLQVALAEAARHRILTLRALGQLEKDHRWLVQSMRG
jgi:DNA polymerase III subunit epsilon